jgi:hypothetical protein
MTHQIKLLTTVTELVADKTFEMAFTAQSKAQNLKEEPL